MYLCSRKFLFAVALIESFEKTGNTLFKYRGQIPVLIFLLSLPILFLTNESLYQGLYAGKYSAPDYEMILEQNCDLAMENTMIYHNPEVKEQLENLGIPVMVEHSSYEAHPLGRLEWIKLYGVLLGKETEATEQYESWLKELEPVMEMENTGQTVAFFYITQNKTVNIRKTNDYIAKMIELAGGNYIFSYLDQEEENALSTMNIDMEEFYSTAKDADYLIYNCTIDEELHSLDELLQKNALLAEDCDSLQQQTIKFSYYLVILKNSRAVF